MFSIKLADITYPDDVKEEEVIGMDVDKAVTMFKENNKDFKVLKNHYMESYQYIEGSKTIRVLYDNDNKVYAVNRK
jgi:hypothetical protein